jgi:hypothetical protein
VDKSLLICSYLKTEKNIYEAKMPGWGKTHNLRMLYDFFRIGKEEDDLSSRIDKFKDMNIFKDSVLDFKYIADSI